jgi:hypothetical protein
MVAELRVLRHEFAWCEDEGRGALSEWPIHPGRFAADPDLSIGEEHSAHDLLAAEFLPDLCARGGKSGGEILLTTVEPLGWHRDADGHGRRIGGIDQRTDSADAVGVLLPV